MSGWEKYLNPLLLGAWAHRKAWGSPLSMLAVLAVLILSDGFLEQTTKISIEVAVVAMWFFGDVRRRWDMHRAELALAAAKEEAKQAKEWQIAESARLKEQEDAEWLPATTLVVGQMSHTFRARRPGVQNFTELVDFLQATAATVVLQAGSPHFKQALRYASGLLSELLASGNVPEVGIGCLQLKLRSLEEANAALKRARRATAVATSATSKQEDTEIFDPAEEPEEEPVVPTGPLCEICGKRPLYGTVQLVEADGMIEKKICMGCINEVKPASKIVKFTPFATAALATV